MSGRPRPSQSLGPQGDPAQGPPDVVDPLWVLKAFGLVLVAALICGYLTVCLLFYQGQWQLVLHPSRAIPAPVTIAGAPYETIQFDVDEAATPQLVGWWISENANARYSAYTILYLPSGDQSLAASAQTLSVLHEIGLNIFAFDYRGYGQSALTHPNQRRMTEDAAAAWKYLVDSRHLPARTIIPFGDGVGASLAVSLAASHSETPVVVVQAPRPDLIQVVLNDPRTASLPVHMLFHDRFEIAEPLAALRTPKLLILADPAPPQVELAATNAAAPKMVSTIPEAQFNGPIYRAQLVRFFDEYLR